MKTPKVAFIGWNPFQLMQVKPILIEMKNACFVLERRNSNWEFFSEELLQSSNIPIHYVNKGDLASLDGCFDILVCQTPFEGIHLFSQTAIVMLQYGYAKEAHNYGLWRSFAHLNLTFGPYATQKIQLYSNAITVGNPRYEDWHTDLFHRQAKQKYHHLLDSAKPTILYAPTWGELSSFPKYGDVLGLLSREYNVLFKVHHNMDLLAPFVEHDLDRLRGVILFGANDDILSLISVSDIVISDYSGAIFDAIYCNRPVILCNGNIEALLGEKVDCYSLEYLRRTELGVEIDSPSDLGEAIKYVLSNPFIVVEKAKKLRGELFLEVNNSVSAIIHLLNNFDKKNYSFSQSQLYINKTMSELYYIKNAYKESRKNWIYGSWKQFMSFITKFHL